MSLVLVRDICKSFGDLEVLKGVDFDVNQGEVVAIIGRSGSGKSTLLRILNGLESYDSGFMSIEDKRVTGLEPDLRPLRLNVGMVFQQFNLFPHLTAGENVMLAPQQVKGVSKKEVKKLAIKMLSKVGLDDKFHSYPDQLSGGQQQRVAIARSLAMEPKVLLCDEITSALDPELVWEVLEVVQGLAAEGMTLVMVTHEMRFAKAVCDKLIFMHEGKVHEIGHPKDLFANPATPELTSFISSIH